MLYSYSCGRMISCMFYYALLMCIEADLTETVTGRFDKWTEKFVLKILLKMLTIKLSANQKTDRDGSHMEKYIVTAGPGRGGSSPLSPHESV